MPSGSIKPSALAALAALAVIASPAVSAYPGMPAGHPAVSHPDLTLFEMISAGIAVHRGQADFACDAWMDAARNTSSAELAGMAWEAAVAARDSAKTLAAAKLWLSLDPNSSAARQTLLADAIERADAEGIRAELAAFERLAEASPDLKGDEKADWIAALLASLSKTKPSPGLKMTAEALGGYAEKHPKRTDIQIGYAQLLGRTGEPARACSMAEAAAKRKDITSELIGQAADVCWQAGSMAKSREMLERYLKKHPDDSFVLLIFGRVEERLGRRASALEALERAMKQPPEDPRVAYTAGELAADLGDAPRTEAYFKRYVEMLRAESEDIDLSRLDVWLRLGSAALMQKSPERAAAYFSELRGGPFAVDARIRQALSLADCGKPEEALAALREGRNELKLDAPALMSAEAKLLLELDRRDEALALITEAAQTYPSEPEVLYDAAMIAEEAGERADAEKHLRALLTVSPAHIQAANALGYLLTQENKNLSEARELLERAYRAEPLSPYILDSMAWLCYREGRFRAAEQFASASLKRMWDEEVALHLAEIFAAQGKTSDAEEALRELLRRGGSMDDAKRVADKWKLALPEEHAEDQTP